MYELYVLQHSIFDTNNNGFVRSYHPNKPFNLDHHTGNKQ